MAEEIISKATEAGYSGDQVVANMIHELRSAMNNIACLAQALKEYRGLRPILRLQDGRLDRNVPIRLVMQCRVCFLFGRSCRQAWNEQVGLAKKSQNYISVTPPTQKPGTSVRIDSDFTEEV